MLREGGLEPLDPFTKPKAWRLTRCLTYGCEAHYRFEYTLEKNGYGEATCRACYWRQWAQEARQAMGVRGSEPGSGRPGAGARREERIRLPQSVFEICRVGGGGGSLGGV